MELVYRRCCGIDVHKESVELCILPAVGQTGEPIRKEVRHVSQSVDPDASVAEAVAGHRHRDGIHRCVLAAAVERSTGTGFQLVAGESSTGQGRRAERGWNQ